MSNQIVISSGAKVRELEGVLTGTAGIVNALSINVPNGIPQLDGSGKILVSQLPNSVMEYKGSWNAATNTPTLVNGTGNAGDVYLCEVAGTVNFGAGPITFAVGDQVIYSGSIWQRASGATGTVTSVAVTESGDALTITGSPITTSGTINIGFAGTSGQYINGAGGLTSFPSLTGFVPYTGATANVDLGNFNFDANEISGGSIIAKLNGPASSPFVLKTGSSGYVIGDDAISLVSSPTTANTLILASNIGVVTKTAQIALGSLSATRTFTLPDVSGTLALLEGTQTFTGGKTFSFAPRNDGGILLKNNVTTGSSGYVSVGSNGAGLTIGVHNSGTNYYHELLMPNSASYNYTFPAANGTLALTSDIPSLTGYVPYTGATANVNLGTFDLTADVITGATGSFASSGGSDSFAINHSSGSGIALNITKGGNGEGLYINKTSGSGNAATIIGTLNATTLVKSGGTSSQFLKADGSVDSSTYLTTGSAATTYVPYTGATASVNLGIYSLTSTGLVVIKNGSSVSGIVFEQGAGIGVGGAGFSTIGPIGSARFGFFFGGSTQSFVFNATPITTQRAYTMPDADGTIALTSDLSAYLPLAGGTLTGALTGTSATFSSTIGTGGDITITKASDASFIANNTSASGKSYRLVSKDDGKFYIQNTGVADLFNIASSGAATFSSSVQTTDLRYSGSGYITWNTNGSGSENLIFRQDASERMRITSGGNVGIGTSSPLQTATNRTVLTVNGTSSALMNLAVGGNLAAYWFSGGTSSQLYSVGQLDFNTSNATGFNFNPNGVEAMRITSGGNVSFNGNSDVANVNDKFSLGYFNSNYGWLQTWNSTSLYLNKLGNAVYAGSVRLDTLSDIRVKDNIQPIEGALNKVLSITGKKFHLKDEDESKIRYGFIAQELEGVLDEFVIQTDMTFKHKELEVENVKSIENWGSSWGALLVEAIKEQQLQIQEQQAQIEELKELIKNK
jgi:hypothetical protein